MMLLGLILAVHLIYILAGLGLREAGIQLNLRWLFWNLGLAVMPGCPGSAGLLIN